MFIYLFSRAFIIHLFIYLFIYSFIYYCFLLSHLSTLYFLIISFKAIQYLIFNLFSKECEIYHWRHIIKLLQSYKILSYIYMYGFYLVLSLYSPSLLNIPWYMSSEPNKNKHTCKGKKKKSRSCNIGNFLFYKSVMCFLSCALSLNSKCLFLNTTMGDQARIFQPIAAKNVTRDILAWSLLSFKLRSALPSFFLFSLLKLSMIRSCFPSIFFFSAFTFSLFRTHYIRKHSSLKLCTPFF